MTGVHCVSWPAWICAALLGSAGSLFAHATAPTTDVPLIMPLTIAAAVASPATLPWWPVDAVCEARPAPFLVPGLTTMSGMFLLQPFDSTRLGMALHARGEPGTWTQWSAQLTGATQITRTFTVGATLKVATLIARGAAMHANVSLSVAGNMMLSDQWSVGAAVMDIGEHTSTLVLRSTHVVDPAWRCCAELHAGTTTAVLLMAQWSALDRIVFQAAIRTAPRTVSAGAAMRITESVTLVVEPCFIVDLGLTTTLGVQWSSF